MRAALQPPADQPPASVQVMTVADRTELESVVPRPAEQTLPYPGAVFNAAIREGLGTAPALHVLVAPELWCLCAAACRESRGELQMQCIADTSRCHGMPALCDARMESRVQSFGQSHAHAEVHVEPELTLWV